MSERKGRFRLKELARERGLGLDDLARKSGLKYATVQGIWQGRVSSPRYDTLKALAEALNVSIEDLAWPEEEAPGQADENVLTPRPTV